MKKQKTSRRSNDERFVNFACKVTPRQPSEDHRNMSLIPDQRRPYAILFRSRVNWLFL